MHFNNLNYFSTLNEPFSTFDGTLICSIKGAYWYLKGAYDYPKNAYF